MELIPMYKGMPFSPVTSLADSIGEADTTITVENGSALPDGPNLAVIGTDESGEVILYAVKAENTLSGCTRGVEGTAQAWNAGSVIGRNWANRDYQALIDNITDLNNGKLEKIPPAAAGNFAALGEDGSIQDSGKKPADFAAVEEGKGLSTNDYTNTEKQEVAKVKDKADKVQEAVDGNFAALDADGNLKDSGKKPSDFVGAESGKGLSTNDFTNEYKAEVAKVKDKANKAVAISASLTVEGWTGDTVPYTQTISAAGVTADASQVIEVGTSEEASTDVYKMAAECMIKAKSKAEGTVTVEALEKKPTAEIPIWVVIYG